MTEEVAKRNQDARIATDLDDALGDAIRTPQGACTVRYPSESSRGRSPARAFFGTVGGGALLSDFLGFFGLTCATGRRKSQPSYRGRSLHRWTRHLVAHDAPLAKASRRE